MEFENKKLRDVADIAARIMMGEKALHPNQQKLDVHEPEKDELTAKDFEMLRKGKKAEVKKEEVSKPDFIDLDKDGDKKEPMKKASSDKKMMKKEEIDQAAATILEYESKDGKFVHRARPGAYGGTKDERHAVDTMSGPKEKDLKNIEKDSSMYKKGYHGTSKHYLRKDTQDYFAKRFSENLDLYKEQGLKGLFEALKKKEVMVEEPTSAEFDAQLADAKQRAAGTKKQPEISKPAVQAVQNEETHTTVEFIDYNDVNGVKISEIDLEERSMTEPEMKKKEEIVKSMKKGISGFKDRYGDRAKEVMYATATKRAMGEEVEQIEEGTPDGYQNRDGKLIPKIHPTMTPHEHGHDYTTQSIEDAKSKSEIHSQHREILKDNPHPKGSKEHKDWEAGANKAKADHLKDWS